MTTIPDYLSVHWTCVECNQDFPTSVSMHLCMTCSGDVCATCFDGAVDCCHRCADDYWCAETDVLDRVHERPGSTLDEITTALRAARMEAEPTRIPTPAWWVLRVRDLVSGLMTGGYLRCRWSRCSMRVGDAPGPLCEYLLADKGVEYFRLPVQQKVGA